ncbi:MAG TPA: hypothetical protein ENH50_03495 [Nitrospirae bacterium]|nr:hypothetical protein [Nitrospirota bacterium]
MKSLITCLALAGVLLIGTSVYAFGPNGLVGSMGSGIMGSGIMGSGIMGSGIMGSGIMGSGIMVPESGTGLESGLNIPTGIQAIDDGKFQGKRYQGTDSYRTNSNNSCK